MPWVIYTLLSLPVALLGLLAGGFIGTACVRWYRISSFEGGSGYFVVGLALLGGAIGLTTGLVTAGIRAPQGGAGYLTTFGVAAGGVALLALLILGVCWLRADIAPEIDGAPLILEIELRLPVFVTESPAAGVGESSLTLFSVVNQIGRKRRTGTLRPADARQEEGRWIVPGDVEVFTMRGRRCLDIQFNGASVQGFVVPLPARPGKEFLNWSDWGPQPPAPQPPWPDTKLSYRFRVQKIAASR